MKNSNFPLMAAVMAVAVVLSSPVMAEGTPIGKGKNMPVFADCDLNGDGSITETEFLKARSERIAKRLPTHRHFRISIPMMMEC